jgi:PASTA domain
VSARLIALGVAAALLSAYAPPGDAARRAQPCAVPDLLTQLLPKRDLFWVVETLVRSGCSTGKVTVTGNWKLDGLRLVEQTPPPGTRLAAGARVDVGFEYFYFVRPGGPPHGSTRDSTPPASSRRCLVPAVKGQRPVAAMERVARGGCATSALRGFTQRTFTEGRVVAQMPAAGKKLARNGRVTLVLGLRTR